MYSGMFYAIANGGDGFTDGSSSVFLAALAVVAFIVIQLFVVKFLWNTVLVRVTTVAKPIPSLIYTLGLLVLVAMLFPGHL